MIIGLVLTIIIWMLLAYLDYKDLSISNNVYYGSLLIFGLILIFNLITNFKIAFVSAIVGIGIYFAIRWYIKDYTAPADQHIMALSLIIFPLESITGLGLIALRGTIQKDKYFPALTFFAIGFIIAALFLLWP